MKSYQSLPMRLGFFVKLKYQSKGAISWPERRIDALNAGLRPKNKDATCGRSEETQKDKLSCVIASNWLFV